MTEINKQIGKYNVISVLGRGATSTVYKCVDPFTNLIYAIKVIENDENNKTFLHEASLAGKLNHPSITKISDAFDYNGTNCLVIEYVDGTPLDKFAKDKPKLLPIDEVIQIIFKCCLALDYASKNNIIHRDIKPANILYTNSKDVKITDFGASFISDTTSTQIMGIGSPAYMSPEQIHEEHLDFRTDIYSLGVVMYCLLTGSLPYDAENLPSLISKKISEDPIHIRIKRSEVDNQLATIAHKAFHRDKKERYQEWADFAMDIANYSKNKELSKTAEEITPTGMAVQDSERYNLMHSLAFFSKFTEVELLETMKICEWGKLPKGKTLIKEGETGQSFFIIANGEAEVIINHIPVAILKTGDCFGEISHLVPLKPRRTATVNSASDVTLIKINGQKINSSNTNIRLRFSEAFIDILVARLDKANSETVRLKTLIKHAT